jgi:beta-glucosidase
MHMHTHTSKIGVSAFFYILLFLWVQDAAAILGFRRRDFPQDFVSGAGTSAYQVS